MSPAPPQKGLPAAPPLWGGPFFDLPLCCELRAGRAALLCGLRAAWHFWRFQCGDPKWGWFMVEEWGYSNVINHPSSWWFIPPIKHGDEWGMVHYCYTSIISLRCMMTGVSLFQVSMSGNDGSYREIIPLLWSKYSGLWIPIIYPFWWFGTIVTFLIYIGNNRPDWLSYFSEGWLNHQPVFWMSNQIESLPGFLLAASLELCGTIVSPPVAQVSCPIFWNQIPILVLFHRQHVHILCISGLLICITRSSKYLRSLGKDGRSRITCGLYQLLCVLEGIL